MMTTDGLALPAPETEADRPLYTIRDLAASSGIEPIDLAWRWAEAWYSWRYPNWRHQ